MESFQDLGENLDMRVLSNELMVLKWIPTMVAPAPIGLGVHCPRGRVGESESPQ